MVRDVLAGREDVHAGAAVARPAGDLGADAEPQEGEDAVGQAGDVSLDRGVGGGDLGEVFVFAVGLQVDVEGAAEGELDAVEVRDPGGSAGVDAARVGGALAAREDAFEVEGQGVAKARERGGAGARR